MANTSLTSLTQGAAAEQAGRRPQIATRARADGTERLAGQRDSLRPVLRKTWDEWEMEEGEACPFDIDERVDQLSPG